MVTEIKFENLGALFSPKKTEKTEANQPVAAADLDGITVSNHFAPLIHTMIAENNVLDQHSRVMEMKNRIAKNGYKIDTDTLAKKIFQDVFANRIR